MNQVVVNPPAKVNLLDFDRQGLRDFFTQIGEKPYRAEQVMKWIYHDLEDNFENMTDVGKALRAKLTEVCYIGAPKTLLDKAATDGTHKWLLGMDSGNAIETVYIPEPTRGTLCVSSQIGCALNCSFCSTGAQGFNRNLSTAEIIGQVWVAAKYLGNITHQNRRITNVVMMGMGEPLANYPRVIAAVRRLTAPAPEGLGLSQRHITVSTVGLVPAMRRLIAEELSVTLALSLHAPDDDLRDELVPVNQRWKVAEVLDAAFDYAARTGRRISIEYALIRDVNDQPWRADLLGRLLRGKLAHVNLIPLNPTPGSKWDASPKPVEREFVRRLLDAGVATTVRDTRGREIDGACGQLAAGELSEASAGGAAADAEVAQ